MKPTTKFALKRIGDETRLVKLFGFTYARVGDIRQLTFLNRLLFSSVGKHWAICFQLVWPWVARQPGPNDDR